MTNEAKHTKEPWNVYRSNRHETYDIEGEDDCIMQLWRLCEETHNVIPYDNAEANARRIVACVNACRGLPTKELEDIGLVGAVGTVIADLERQLAEAADWKEAVIDHMMVTHVTIGRTPKEKLNAIINWYCEVQCDPASVESNRPLFSVVVSIRYKFHSATPALVRLNSITHTHGFCDHEPAPLIVSQSPLNHVLAFLGSSPLLGKSI